VEEEVLNLMIQYLIQYCIAGIVIYLLFRIVFNDIASIKNELVEIKNEIRRLREVLEKR
jgi:hypothetical protein